MSFEVRLEEISVFRGSASLFSGITAVIPAGGKLAVCGRSGSGKSPLLECAAGVMAPDQGTVFWDSVDLGTASRGVLAELELRSSVVFQEHALISYLPLFENIALPLRHHRRGTKSEIDELVSSLLERFHLTDAARRLPESLSAGEKRLGSIARALAVNPELICIDEPTAGLDAVQRELVLHLFDDLTADPSLSVITASNDPAILSRFGSNLITLN